MAAAPGLPRRLCRLRHGGRAGHRALRARV